MRSTQKFHWADNIRFLATFGVMVLHASASGLYKFSEIPISHWGILDVVDSTMRCCVPLFVMLSGALLLQQDKELIPYLKNRFLRIVVPFLFWSVVYCIVYIASIWKNLPMEKAPMILAEMLQNIIYFGGLFKLQAFHFWYVYMILSIFLVVPILRKWIKSASEKEIIYFLILWGFSILLLIPAISPYKPNIELSSFSGYLGYFVLGYYLSIKRFEEKSFAKKTNGFCIIILIAFTAFGTYYLSKQNGRLNEELFKYLSPNIILLSVAVFLRLKSTTIKHQRISKWISFINQYSFGMYLVHIIILRILKNAGLNWSFIHPLVGIPLTAMCCFALSFIVIYCLRKIPGGRYFAG